MDLALYFYLMLGFAILMYVVLDGFDLGLGILYPWFDSDEERDHMMRAVAPVWDGNETWLVFGGVILFAAFPMVYGLVLSSLYMPIIIMLLALVFRGVAFEYRFKAKTSRRWWDLAFAAGSTVATFCQGLMAGALVQAGEGGTMGASSLDWFTPFSILTAFALMAGYALLAATFLVLKTRDSLAARAAVLGQRLVWAVLGALAVISLWSLAVNPEVRARWLDEGQFWWLWILPAMSVIIGIRLHSHLTMKSCERRPFALAIGLFGLSFAGLLVGTFPYLVPYQITLWDAQSPQNSLMFAAVGVTIMVPIILAYTFWGYHVFRGKVEDFEAGY